jgi:hypothetical protein
MSDVVRVEMPAELAHSLTGDGFDEVVIFRGLGTDVHAILTVVPAGLAVAASAATILVSRTAAGDLVAAIRSWMGHHTKPQEGSEFVVEISVRNGHASSHLRLTSRRDAPGQVPNIDITALASLVESMFAGDPGDHNGLPRAPE